MTRPTTAGRVRLAAAAAALAASAAASTEEPRGRFQVRIAWPPTAAAVERALAGASDRLDDPRCAGVVGDFEDVEGRPLAAALDEKGRGLQEHLGFLFFYDGSTRAGCRASRTLAYTSPGSHVVFVCGQKFAEAENERPDWAEVYLIHEALHTLGLGEDPPAAAEITAAVMDRCVRPPAREAALR